MPESPELPFWTRRSTMLAARNPAEKNPVRKETKEAIVCELNLQDQSYGFIFIRQEVFSIVNPGTIKIS